MTAICEKCQKPIHWMPEWSGNVILCEREKIIVYTERGRKVEGYPLHICNGEKAGGNIVAKTGAS